MTIQDISPELLEEIQAEFQANTANSETVQKLLRVLSEGGATYRDAYKYAEKIGESLSQAFLDVLSADKLPDGRMYYNIAKSLLEPTLGANFELVTDYTAEVQQGLNKTAGLSLGAVKAVQDEKRIANLIDKISDAEDFERVKWLLKEPVINYSQHVVDLTQKANLDVHYKAGLQPTIKRVSSGNCCSWCSNLAGTYSYPDDVPDDVYRRHRACRCMVIYNPKDGRGVQDINARNTWYKNDSELAERAQKSNLVTSEFNSKKQTEARKARLSENSKISTSKMSMKQLRQHQDDLAKQLKANGKSAEVGTATSRAELSEQVLKMRKELYKRRKT